MWKGEDAYVIGGGPSLRKFDWGSISGKNTIGCNSAFILGSDICQIVVFGDIGWWENIGRQGTEEYGGIVVGCSNKLHNANCPWLLTMERNGKAEFGIDKLVWAGNTGSLAINLALILGARRVFLLGFDMFTKNMSDPNWHLVRRLTPSKNAEPPYPRFIAEFNRISRSLPRIFPGREVINVTDESKLEGFPKVSLREHFAERTTTV